MGKCRFLFNELAFMIVGNLNLKDKTRLINHIIRSLPFTSDIKKILFDLTVGMINGVTQSDDAMDQLAKVKFVLDKTELFSFSPVFNETSEKLNDFLDKLCSLIDLENITDLNEIVISFRHLVNSLFYLIQEQENKLPNSLKTSAN